jgi:EmrB/QacA subfamily drug resistance transporter
VTASTGRHWPVLVAACLAATMTTVDATVVNVALPSIAHDLDATAGELQWSVLGYTLMFAVLLVPAGRLADLLGSERLWRVGVTMFAAASLLSALAPSGELLVAGRLLQGAGAAAMKPATVAIVAAAFGPERRGWALGVMGSTLAAAAAAGPVLGSVLVATVSWRAIFLVNLPIALLAVVLMRRGPDGQVVARGSRPRLDLVGAALLAPAMVAVVLAVSGTETLALAALALALFAAFIARERRAASPIVELRLFRSRGYAVGNAISVLTSISFFGLFFLQSLLLQDVMGFSALMGGVLLVPLGAATLLSSTVGGRLADRYGSGLPIRCGLVLTTAAALLLARVDADSSYLGTVLPAYLLEGLGWGLVSAPLNSLVIGAAGDAHHGEAAGVMATLDKLGAALGVGIAGGLLATHGGVSGGSAAVLDAFTPTMVVAAVAMGLALVLTGAMRPAPATAVASRQPT